MEIKKESNDYIIKLNNFEVLVFFECLVKFVENNEIIDEAEQKILYDLECLLESTLEEPFMENYKNLLLIISKLQIETSLNKLVKAKIFKKDGTKEI